MSDALIEVGTLEGHGDWVTSIATSQENSDIVLSASRDKSILVWQLTREEGSKTLKVSFFE